MTRPTFHTQWNEIISNHTVYIGKDRFVKDEAMIKLRELVLAELLKTKFMRIDELPDYLKKEMDDWVKETRKMADSIMTMADAMDGAKNAIIGLSMAETIAEYEKELAK